MIPKKVNNKCIVNNTKCTLGTNELILKNNSLTVTGTLVKTYVSEFNYTEKYISQHLNENYTMIIFRDANCVKELSLEMPYSDFQPCYKYLQEAYNINESLIISLVEKKGYINPITFYSFFHPK